MYLVQYDLARCCFLSYTEGPVSDAEWDYSLRSLERVLQEARQRDIAAANLVLIGPNADRPNATRRKALAELRNQRGDVRSLGAFVSASLLLRGFLRTLDWIVPKHPREENFIASNFADAVAWLEQKRGEKLAVFWSLYRGLEASHPMRRIS